MANVDAVVQQGVAALKAGRRDEARRILVRATELDERNEQAWLWLSGCVDSSDEQRICLENVLSINPANTKAQRGLDALNKSAPAASTSPFAEGDFDSNPYAGTGFDSNPYGNSSNDPAVSTGWDRFDAANANFSSTPTSVEWSNSDRPAAHGSGKDVPQPTSDEYDQWVDNLQLGSSAASGAPTSDSGFDPLSGPFGNSASAFDDTSSPFDMGGSDPFGSGAFGSSRREEPGAFGAPASSPFGGFGDDEAAPFDNSSETDDDSFGAFPKSDSFSAASNPFGRSDEEIAPGHFDAFPAAKPVPDDVFSGPAGKRGPARAADDSDLFGGVTIGAQPPAGRSSGTSNPFGVSSNVFDEFAPFSDSAAAAEPASGSAPNFLFDDKSTGISPYFASIPNDIQVEGGTKPDMRLMLTVVVLGLLNAVSLGVLVLNLLNRP